jgi:hypothetical protein
VDLVYSVREKGVADGFRDKWRQSGKKCPRLYETARLLPQVWLAVKVFFVYSQTN